MVTLIGRWGWAGRAAWVVAPALGPDPVPVPAPPDPPPPPRKKTVAMMPAATTPIVPRPIRNVRPPPPLAAMGTPIKVNLRSMQKQRPASGAAKRLGRHRGVAQRRHLDPLAGPVGLQDRRDLVQRLARQVARPPVRVGPRQEDDHQALGLATLTGHLGDLVGQLVRRLHLQILGHHVADQRHLHRVVVADVPLPQVGALLQLLGGAQVVDQRGGGLGAHLLELDPQFLPVGRRRALDRLEDRLLVDAQDVLHDLADRGAVAGGGLLDVLAGLALALGLGPGQLQLARQPAFLHLELVDLLVQLRELRQRVGAELGGFVARLLGLHALGLGLVAALGLLGDLAASGLLEVDVLGVKDDEQQVQQRGELEREASSGAGFHGWGRMLRRRRRRACRRRGWGGARRSTRPVRSWPSGSRRGPPLGAPPAASAPAPSPSGAASTRSHTPAQPRYTRSRRRNCARSAMSRWWPSAPAP